MPRSMAKQARILHERGHDVTLFCGTSRMFPFTPNELKIEAIPTTVSKLWGPNLYGFPFRALFRLWQCAKQFDFIHLNGAWNLTTFLAARIAGARNVPYIITMRGHLGEYHFKRMPLLKKILFSTLEKTNIRHAHAMHATAEWEVETSKKALRYAKRIVKIPNPVDLSDFDNPPSRTAARKELGLRDGDFHVIHLGRLAKQKNLPFLFEAFARAKLGPNAFLTCIGPPEPDVQIVLTEQTEKLGIAEQVTFVDFAKGKERCNWLAAADVFALPSFDENFCIVAVESVASGSYCVLSPHIGAVEYLPDELVSVLPLKLDDWIQALREHCLNPRDQFIPSPRALDRISEEGIANAWHRFYAERNKNPSTSVADNPYEASG